MPADSSLTQKAYLRLRSDLLACELPPGERINIQDAARRLAVSLGAVREALSRLTSEGFVVTEAHRGFRAAPISMSDLRDLTQARILIECQCLRLAIANGDVTWEAAVIGAHHRASRTPQKNAGNADCLNDEYAAAHEAFHEALVSACNSPWLLRLRTLLYAQTERYRYLSASVDHNERDSNGEHQAIAEATLARNADLAEKLLGQHLETTARLLQEHSRRSKGFASKVRSPLENENDNARTVAAADQP